MAARGKEGLRAVSREALGTSCSGKMNADDLQGWAGEMRRDEVVEMKQDSWEGGLIEA